MDDFWTALLTAFGLVLVIEGGLYTLFPQGAKNMAALIQTFSTDSLRRGGLITAILGAMLVWLIRGA